MEKSKATKIISCILMATMIFSGCSFSKQKHRDIQLAGYTITDHDGVFYLNFHKENESESEANESGVVVTGLLFESLGEMKETIKNSKFTESQLEIIKSAFPKTDKGILLCDAEQLYEPTTPVGFSAKTVYYAGGEEYSFAMTDSAGGTEVRFSHHSSAVYADRYTSEYENFLQNDQIEFIRQETEGERNSTVIYYRTGVAELKSVQYTIRLQEKILYIQEEYVLKSHNSNLNVSEKIPFNVRVFGRQGDKYFEVYCNRLDTRPSIEWLSAFGLKPFSD